MNGAAITLTIEEKCDIIWSLRSHAGQLAEETYPGLAAMNADTIAELLRLGDLLEHADVTITPWGTR